MNRLPSCHVFLHYAHTTSYIMPIFNFVYITYTHFFTSDSFCDFSMNFWWVLVLCTIILIWFDSLQGTPASEGHATYEVCKSSLKFIYDIVSAILIFFSFGFSKGVDSDKSQDAR
jgi:hypothetical protein